MSVNVIGYEKKEVSLHAYTESNKFHKAINV